MTYEDHLAYEVRQLRCDIERLYDAWPAMHGATPTRLGEGIAYFEASLLHARNLMEFLTRGSSPHADALTPEDFGIDYYDYAAASETFEQDFGSSADSAYSQICTYVSHLSRERDVGTPTWELQPLEQTLLALVRQFVTLCSDKGIELPSVQAALTDEIPDW